MQINAAGGFVILTIAILARPLSAANVADFIDFSLRAPDNSVLLPGRLHVPADESTPRPLVIFLHGGGLSGTDNLAQITDGGIDGLLAEMKVRDAFLLAPQDNLSPNVLSNTMAMIDRAIAEHNVDRNRIYLTGYSAGGGGVWNLLYKNPDRFAAAVPICPVPMDPKLFGVVQNRPYLYLDPDFSTLIVTVNPGPDGNGIDFGTIPIDGETGYAFFDGGNLIEVTIVPTPIPFAPLPVEKLIGQPIWAFHGRQDPTVSVTHTRHMIDSILTLAGQPLPEYPPLDSLVSDLKFKNEMLDLQFTELRRGGHAIWRMVYGRSDVYNWMFAHSLVPEPNSLVLIVMAIGLIGIRRHV